MNFLCYSIFQSLKFFIFSLLGHVLNYSFQYPLDKDVIEVNKLLHESTKTKSYNISNELRSDLYVKPQQIIKALTISLPPVRLKIAQQRWYVLLLSNMSAEHVQAGRHTHSNHQHVHHHTKQQRQQARLLNGR